MLYILFHKAVSGLRQTFCYRQCAVYFSLSTLLTDSLQSLIYALLLSNYTLKIAVSKFLINSLSPICFTNKDKS
jgi:hypothetical protein